MCFFFSCKIPLTHFKRQFTGFTKWWLDSPGDCNPMNGFHMDCARHSLPGCPFEGHWEDQAGNPVSVFIQLLNSLRLPIWVLINVTCKGVFIMRLPWDHPPLWHRLPSSCPQVVNVWSILTCNGILKGSHRVLGQPTSLSAASRSSLGCMQRGSW